MEILIYRQVPKAIKKMLKDPENLDQLDRAGSNVKDIERYIR